MRYYLDTEFIETGERIYPVSLGLVSEDHRSLYIEFADVPWELANRWVLENVYPHLTAIERHTPSEARDLILAFMGSDPEPELWAYYADYDWVLFCQLFGAMTNLPEHFPKFCMDLKQLAMTLGNPRLPPDPLKAHHALADALWVESSHRWLLKYQRFCATHTVSTTD